MSARDGAAGVKRAGRSGANAARGEHDLVLAGKRYRLRPSHEAIVAMEEETDKSLLELLALSNRGGLKQQQIGTVLAELIRAGAEDELTRAVDAERLAELAFEEGVHKVMARITLCLLDAASGGRKSSGEAKAAPAVKSETAGAA